MLKHQIKKQSSPKSQCSPLRPLLVITPSQWTSSISFIIILFIYLLIYLGLHWIFTAASELLPSCSEQGLLYNCGAQALGSWASVVSVLRLESRGSIVVEHRLSCSKSCGISSDQRLNPRLWHWQADSVPLSHQGSHIFPIPGFFLHLLCFM